MIGSVQDIPDRFRVRPASIDELSRIREIENESGSRFSGLGLIDESRDEAFPSERIASLIALGQVWVCGEDGEPAVGMVIVSVWETSTYSTYIEEMDVLSSHGRRGIGTRLLAHVCDWAREQEYSSVILSTFANIPWNGPFYRKNGFTDLKPDEWTAKMHQVRASELRRGLAIEARVFMKKELFRS